MEEKRRARVTLTIRSDVLEASRKLAESENRSLSNLVELALMERLKDAEE